MVWRRQMYTHHEKVGWWGIPNLKTCEIEHAAFGIVRTNSIGMRSDRDYPLKRPEGRQRIVLLGDSYTAGWTVKVSDRFSDLLEHSYPNLDVMNFGLPGSGTAQQLLVYETFAKPFESDAYIFAPFWNNILRNSEGRWLWRAGLRAAWISKPYFTLEDEGLVLHNVPVPEKLAFDAEALEAEKHLGEFDTGRKPTRFRTKLFYALAKPNAGYDSEDSPSWRLMRAILQRFIEQVDGKPVFILPLPDQCHICFDIAPTYLARYEKLHNPARNCFVVDPLPYFQRLSHEQRRKCCGERDPHYSPIGHKVVAEAISDALETHCPTVLNARS